MTWGRDTDTHEAADQCRAYIEAGGNFFDTASTYGDGDERLDAVAATLDGFELSRIDLEQRREGDVLGSSQSGTRSHLRLLRVLRDESMIVQVHREDSESLEHVILQQVTEILPSHSTHTKS